jgi:PAS domain S-box-containing protein
MAPADQVEESRALREKLAGLAAELLRERQARQVSEERFRHLLDAAPVMIWTCGPDALCTFVNRAWVEFRGRTQNDELANGWTEGIHPDDRDLYLETYLKAFSARLPFHAQYRARRPNGEYSWVEVSGMPLFDLDGAFMGFMGTAVDISDRKRTAFTPDETAVRLVFSLTERERQVLVHIADGKSTKETAARLGISYKTADSHRSRILEKLGVHETASMVRYAIRAGLVQA